MKWVSTSWTYSMMKKLNKENFVRHKQAVAEPKPQNDSQTFSVRNPMNNQPTEMKVIAQEIKDHPFRFTLPTDNSKGKSNWIGSRFGFKKRVENTKTQHIESIV